MAATGTKQQQQPTATPAADPKFEWSEKAGTYVLRISLQGFRKDDFRVQVDKEGRITVRGATRPNAGSSLHKVFQLPADASRDDIAGRFEAGVLTLTATKRAGAPKEETAAKMAPTTEQVDGAGKKEDAGGEKKVPENASSGVVAPTPIDEIMTKPKEEGASKTPPREHDDTKKMPAKDDDAENKESVEPKESVFRRTIRQISERVQRMEEEANRRKQEQLKLAPATKKEQEVEAKPKAPQESAPAAKKEQEIVEVKPKAPQAAAAAVTNEEKPAPNPTSGEKANTMANEESLVRRDDDEEKAKAATVATAMEAQAEAEGKKKATLSACTAWKERVVREVKGLKDMKWADNAVEMAMKNKEMVAIGVAAFSLGFFVSRRLFSK